MGRSVIRTIYRRRQHRHKNEPLSSNSSKTLGVVAQEKRSEVAEAKREYPLAPPSVVHNVDATTCESEAFTVVVTKHSSKAEVAEPRRAPTTAAKDVDVATSVREVVANVITENPAGAG
jgi:hypothetical protein